MWPDSIGLGSGASPTNLGLGRPSMSWNCFEPMFASTCAMSKIEPLRTSHVYSAGLELVASTGFLSRSTGCASDSHMGKPPLRMETLACPMALNMYHARGELKTPFPSYTTTWLSRLIPYPAQYFANVGADGIMCGQGESVSLTLSMSKKNAPGILLSENSLMASRCIAGRYQEASKIETFSRFLCSQSQSTIGGQSAIIEGLWCVW
mmetsp:Transcript_45948/g.144137  ORF Transcript_45948/g.144137 Transcript_45948/m.144137 type:complete len:207 (+) Transcript_45948:654-1274(+)